MVDEMVYTYDGKFILSKYTLLEGGEAKTIQYIKVFSKAFPEGKLFKIWLLLEGRMLLIADKVLWIYYVIPKPTSIREIYRCFKRSLFSFFCQPYCSKKVKRIHLSCFWCRARRIMEGKIDNPVKVDLYIDVVHKDIKLNELRQYLIKNLTSLKELIGGW